MALVELLELLLNGDAARRQSTLVVLLGATSSIIHIWPWCLSMTSVSQTNGTNKSTPLWWGVLLL